MISVEAKPKKTQNVPRTPPNQRWDMVDGLRGIAALAVCWFHMSHGGALLSRGWLQFASEQCWLGVEVFFVISGFVIPWSMVREDYVWSDYLRFAGKRIARLHPPYVLALLGVILLNRASALVPGFKGENFDLFSVGTLAALGRDFFYLSGWLGQPWIIVVSWSLAIEIQFYLAAGIVLPLFPARGSWRVATGILIVCAISFFWPDPRGLGHYLPLFLLGWSLALFVFARQAGYISVPFVAAAVGCAAVIAATSGFLVFTAASLGACCIVVGMFVRPVPALLWLGGISYSLYLVHVPIGGRVVNFGLRFPSMPPLLLVITGVAASLSAAWAFNRWVERPVLLWSRAVFAKAGGQAPPVGCRQELSQGS